MPSGSHIALEYEEGRPPVLAVRIQEMFGLTETPRVAGGRVKVLLHLLAPNYRPQQVTDDLASFWKNGYPLVRKELRGRYPKHSWPDDPLTAEAVAGRSGERRNRRCADARPARRGISFASSASLRHPRSLHGFHHASSFFVSSSTLSGCFAARFVLLASGPSTGRTAPACRPSRSAACGTISFQLPSITQRYCRFAAGLVDVDRVVLEDLAEQRVAASRPSAGRAG